MHKNQQMLYVFIIHKTNKYSSLCVCVCVCIHSYSYSCVCITGECFPWTPKPLYDLSTLEPEILGEMNDQVTCVVLCAGCDDATKAQVNEAMLPVATEAFEAAKASGCEVS